MLNWFKKKAPPVTLGSPEANQSVRDELAGMGDNGLSRRHVVHYAYPLGALTVADRKQLDQWLFSKGFRVKTVSGEDGIMFEAEQVVAEDGFDILTQEVAAYLDTMDWQYDGWECAVCPTSAA